MATLSRKEHKIAQKREYHAKQKAKPSSSTSGRSKNIYASPLQRGICRRNRSWRHPQYETVMKSLGRKNDQ